MMRGPVEAVVSSQVRASALALESTIPKTILSAKALETLGAVASSISPPSTSLTAIEAIASSLRLHAAPTLPLSSEVFASLESWGAVSAALNTPAMASAVSALQRVNYALPASNTAALIGKINLSAITGLTEKLGGAVDTTNLMRSLVAGADVGRAWGLGTFRSDLSIPLPGFDEAVRELAIEAADETDVDLSLPHEEIVYAPQPHREPLSMRWMVARSEALVHGIQSPLLDLRDIALAARWYVRALVFIALLQGQGAINNGPLPDWAVDTVEVVAAVDFATNLGRRRDA